MSKKEGTENWNLIPENTRVRYQARGRGGRNCGDYYATLVNQHSVIPSDSEMRLLPGGRTSFKSMNQWATAVRKMLLERMGLASAAINIWDDPRVTFQDANNEWKPFNSIRVPVAVEAPPAVVVEAPPEVQEEEAPPVPEADDVMQVVQSALKKVNRRASIAAATAQVALQEADALRAELAQANRRASVAEAAHERVKEMLREMAQMAADLVQMAEEV